MNSNNIFSAGAYKLTAFSDRLKSWKNGDSVVPVTLEIQPTEKCSHSCPLCQSYLTLGKAEAKRRARNGVDLDLSLLSSIWDAPPEGVVLSGNTGDPLLHPHIKTLLGTLYEKRIPSVLITNGEYITEDIADLAVKACRGIRVSLDAYDERSFKHTHGASASWKKVIKGIKVLRKASRNSPDCYLGIGYLTDKRTASGMIKATRLAMEMEVDYIQFRPYHNRISSIKKQLEICKIIAKGTNTVVLSSDQKYHSWGGCRTYKECHASAFYAVLDARADLYICCHHVGQKSARTGNLKSIRWDKWIQSNKRKAVATCYPNSDCVAGCRLHTHNEFLETLRKMSKISLPDNVIISRKILSHACFL